MATKKKVLQEQEIPVPENAVPMDGTVSSDGILADAAAPPDNDDLNALLASMDQADDDTSMGQSDGGATSEGSDPLPEFSETEEPDEAASEDGSEDGGAAAGTPSDLDEPAEPVAGEDGDGEGETSADLSA